MAQGISVAATATIALGLAQNTIAELVPGPAGELGDQGVDCDKQVLFTAYREQGRGGKGGRGWFFAGEFAEFLPVCGGWSCGKWEGQAAHRSARPARPLRRGPGSGYNGGSLQWQPASGGSSPLNGKDMDEAAVNDAVDRLVDEYRIRCLWFMRPDYYPATREQRLSALKYIEHHGDREAFSRAGTLRLWFSRHSSGISAGS